MQPGQQKITQFDEVTSTQSGDVIPIVRGGQNKRITVENFTGVLPDGWLTPAEVWTFSSFGNNLGVITIPEGNIDRYPNGTRVWFKQGTPTPTNRYGIVVASTTTTLTISMVADTTLQNLAIQQPAVSSIAAPRTPENVEFKNVQTLLKVIQSSAQSIGSTSVTANFTTIAQRSGVGLSLSGNSILIGQGIKQVRVHYSAMAENGSGATYLFVRLHKNVTTVAGEQSQQIAPFTGGGFSAVSETVTFDVVPGDTILLRWDVGGGSASMNPYRRNSMTVEAIG